MTDPNQIEKDIQDVVDEVKKDAPPLVEDVETKNYVKAVEDVAADVPVVAPHVVHVVNETKSGYKTTEFWMVSVYELLTNITAIHAPWVTGHTRWIETAAGVVAYVISRGISKAGVGNSLYRSKP